MKATDVEDGLEELIGYLSFFVFISPRERSRERTLVLNVRTLLQNFKE